MPSVVLIKHIHSSLKKSGLSHEDTGLWLREDHF
jgi:hypothetical protein